MDLNKITKGVSEHREKKRTKVWALGFSNIKGRGEEEKATKETKNEQPVR